MTLQSYVAKAYMLSYIQQKSVEFYYVVQATSKPAPTDLNRTNVFFQAEDGIRDQPRSRGLGDVYKRQPFHVVFS